MNEKTKGVVMTVVGVLLTCTAAAGSLFGPKLFGDGQAKVEQAKLKDNSAPFRTDHAQEGHYQDL